MKKQNQYKLKDQDWDSQIDRVYYINIEQYITTYTAIQKTAPLSLSRQHPIITPSMPIKSYISLPASLFSWWGRSG